MASAAQANQWMTSKHTSNIISNQPQYQKSQQTTMTTMTSQPPDTRQLDFNQAMQDFKHMFPTMEEEVIEAVLRANNGAVDETIDQLLTMNIDNEDDSVPLHLLKEEHDSVQPQERVSEDAPPSYAEAMQTAPDNISLRSETVPKQSLPEEDWLALLTSPNTQPKPGKGVASTPSGSPYSSQAAPPYSPQVPPYSSHPTTPVNSTHPSMPKMGVSEYTPRVKRNNYRRWNPPLLGKLPDEFLRIVPTDEQIRAKQSLQLQQQQFLRTDWYSPQYTPQTHLPSRGQLHPPGWGQLHTQHQQHHHQQRTQWADQPEGTQNWRQPLLDQKVPPRGRQHFRSQSMNEFERKSKPKKLDSRLVHKSLSIRESTQPRPVNGSQNGQPLQGSEFSSHSQMLQKRMAENERRRASTNRELDPEMAQYLEDERLAILMQNQEFLRELRGNEEFMKTLERDRMNRTAFEFHNAPDSTSSSEEDNTPRLQNRRRRCLSPESTSSSGGEGYGRDNTEELGAFPFTKPLPKDEDVEFQKQLKQMGVPARKKFMAIARKFLSRRKKKSTPKNIYKNASGPSTLNLLEDNDDEELLGGDEEEERQQPETPEFEALPGTTIRNRGTTDAFPGDDDWNRQMQQYYI
ncbi:uncharacterized protein LOC106154498 isoform X2 [Lingula anatina]|uniref:Uncharacterized protein LOC106154498 isoform X2 n=1 Tax=Lingula anatina TaxID=7574 RepID=A0A1S3HH21_LINAN|nr:uncharacterized protein LOC106154498 isoform X2 [Lingula anatina]|eukprot:XP_013384324.1 uncharacterized protein LOC106154498 isoform X2 [Lingula anatina]